MNKKIIIGIAVVLALGLGGWKIWTDYSSGDAKETKASTSENSGENNENSNDNKYTDQSNNEESKGSNSDSKSQQSSTSESNSSSSEDKKTGTNSNSNNSSDSNTSSSTSIKTPYNVSVTGMRISKISGFSGTFVEDGSNKKITNILALEVKNTSKKDLQYGKIKLKINNKKTATFEITNLPAGKTVTVIESTGSITYNSGDNYKYEDATYASVDKLPMNSKKVKVATKDSSITINNISGKDLGTVYVYYKNTKGNSYLGGITYRAKFEDVKKGKSYTGETSHFSEGSSKIVMVDTEK